ncbi:MAG TPA: hypothetical protein VF444_04010 [Pseudonocardiaceae bacterium]
MTVTDSAPRNVPIGPRASQWVTVRNTKRVLVVVHNTVSLTRLLDLLYVFESDFRVQVVFTVEPSDPFRFGLEQFLTDLDVCLIPWQQATLTPFDLVIAANHGGLSQVNGPLMILPHGIGYTKYSPLGAGSREPGAGSREPGAGSREPGAVRAVGAVVVVRRKAAGQRDHPVAPAPT